MGLGVRLFDPQKSRTWKAVAHDHMREAMASARLAPFRGPVCMVITAVFACPRSSWRRRDPRGKEWRIGRPDIDNLAKAILDSGNAVLYLDDAQVARLEVDRISGAQGEPARVEVLVAELRSLGSRQLELGSWDNPR